jgi:mannose-6-phosphate isomerase-like protein (cupin superfamily)
VYTLSMNTTPPNPAELTDPNAEPRSGFSQPGLEELQAAPEVEAHPEIQGILNKLAGIPAADVKAVLDKQAGEVDAKAGIIIAKLEELGETEAGDGQKYRFYAARVKPGTHVNSHWHEEGEEPYDFKNGEKGVMHVGMVVPVVETGRKAVDWEANPAMVGAGDTVVVKEGQAHSFENTSQEEGADVDFVFACPDDHLNESDRFFTEAKDAEGNPLVDNGTPKYLAEQPRA